MGLLLIKATDFSIKQKKAAIEHDESPERYIRQGQIRRELTLELVSHSPLIPFQSQVQETLSVPQSTCKSNQG